jgi:ribosomal protein S18 acetylase RimI-like enzyme
MVFDAEQTNELGLPLARGPFDTLDAAREAVGGARSGPTPTSDLEARPARRRPVLVGPAAKPSASKGPRRAPKRAAATALVIRELRAVDGDALRALWKAAGFRDAGDDDRSLARLARRNPGLVLVATEAGRIVGSAMGAWDGRRGAIYHVTTAESHRRRGIASRLVDQVEAGLRDVGCSEVRVRVANDNRGGRAFWAARGYDLSDTVTFAKAVDSG